MDNVVRVQHDQGVKDASENCSRILLLVLASLLDLVEELLAIQMLYDQMDVVIGLKDLVELEDVGVPDLSEQVYLIMKAQNALNIVFKHCLLNCLQGKFAPLCCMSCLKHFGEVALANDLADFVMAAYVDEHAEVFHELKPSLDVGLVSLLHISLDAVREDDYFVQKSDDNTLFEIEACRTSAMPAAEHDSLGLLLQG